MASESNWLDRYSFAGEWVPGRWSSEAELISWFLDTQPTPPLTGIAIKPGRYFNHKRNQQCAFVEQDRDFIWIDVEGSGRQCWDVLHFRSEWTPFAETCETDN